MAEQPVARIIRIAQVRDRTGLSRSAIYERIHADDHFPRPVRIGLRAVGFVEAEVTAWVERQIANRAKVAR